MYDFDELAACLRRSRPTDDRGQYFSHWWLIHAWLPTCKETIETDWLVQACNAMALLIITNNHACVLFNKPLHASLYWNKEFSRTNSVPLCMVNYWQQKGEVRKLLVQGRPSWLFISLWSAVQCQASPLQGPLIFFAKSVPIMHAHTLCDTNACMQWETLHYSHQWWIQDINHEGANLSNTWCSPPKFNPHYTIQPQKFIAWMIYIDGTSDKLKCYPKSESSISATNYLYGY